MNSLNGFCHHTLACIAIASDFGHNPAMAGAISIGRCAWNIIEQDPEDGGYVICCPTDNIKDAIKTYLESVEDLKRLKKLRTVEVI